MLLRLVLYFSNCSIFIVAALNVLSANAQDEPAASYEVPLFFSADNPDYFSFVQIKDYRLGRFQSRAAPQPITITGYDDEGTKYGPIYLELERFTKGYGRYVGVLYSRNIETEVRQGASEAVSKGVEWPVSM